MSEAATCSLASRPDVTVVPVCARRTVCYEFNTSASGQRNLAIPYVVIINGEVQNQGRPRKLDNSRKINLTVNAGSKVALYLNSDVHPNHRQNAVYEVIVGSKDVIVNITEQTGNRDRARPVVERVVTSEHSETTSVDRYTAKLTGDIWMLISHRYTASEVSAILPPDTPLVIRNAVCNIYRGLAISRLDIPAHSEGPMLRISFMRQSNPEANISRCSLLTDVLPRTHPCAFASLFSAACKVGISLLHITSCWRPSLGSIVHRAGLGLDVNVVCDPRQCIEVDRTDLRTSGRSSNPNISNEEKELRRAADDKAEIRRRRRNDVEAEKEATQSYVDWTTELDRHQPMLIRELRRELQLQPQVQQILDPWYILLSTQNNPGPAPNEQRSSLEKTHDDHLHITIKEPRIL